MMLILALLFCAALCFIVYHFTSRNPGDVRNQHDLDQLNKNPQFDLESKTGQIKRQTEYFGAQQGKVIAIDELEHTGERLKEAEELKKSGHELAKETTDLGIKQTVANKTLVETALEQKMDVPTLMQDTLAERAARRATREAFEREQIRILGYEQEVQVDMQAALGMHMMDVEKLDYISGKIALLKAQNADSERIETLERLRVQMERRLLETNDGKTVEGPEETA